MAQDIAHFGERNAELNQPCCARIAKVVESEVRYPCFTRSRRAGSPRSRSGTLGSGALRNVTPGGCCSAWAVTSSRPHRSSVAMDRDSCQPSGKSRSSAKFGPPSAVFLRDFHAGARPGVPYPRSASRSPPSSASPCASRALNMHAPRTPNSVDESAQRRRSGLPAASGPAMATIQKAMCPKFARARPNPSPKRTTNGVLGRFHPRRDSIRAGSL